MTGMPERRVSGGDDRVRADVGTPEVQVGLGELATVPVEVTNVDQVIRSFAVKVLGLDAQWVSVDHTSLDLFPGERRSITVSLALPDTFPSGRRRVAIEVSEPGLQDGSTVMVGFDLVVAARDALQMTAEPNSQTVGKSGGFILDLANTGNTTLTPKLVADEPERKVEVTFEPAVTEVLPGQQVLVDVLAVGKRPWFGMPVVRPMTITATGGTASVMVPLVLIQKPRISRTVLSLLGLLFVAALFALVINWSFSQAALRAEANEQLLKQGLGEDRPIGPRAAPSSITGQVDSTTGGPIDGAAVQLFDTSNPIVPTHATVTGATGAYRFGTLEEGEYYLRVEVAGFGEVWFPDGETFNDGDVIELGPGTDLIALDIALAGRVGSVSGRVIGADVEGAVVAAEIPGESIEGSELEPTPATVTSVEVDATGEFVLTDLATPSTYEILIAKEGFATERRTVTLRPGEQRDGIEVLLRTGDGRIAGSVVDTAGNPLPNVDIAATDGSSDFETRTLSGDGDLGTFELRGLATPGTYTLSVTRDGFFPESVTLNLDESQQISDVSVVMTADIGSLSGQVTAPDGTPLGGVDITIDGAEDEFTTVSISDGDVGSWLATGLPVPGTYTVTFSQEGRATQALSVELQDGAQANRTGVNAVLAPANASVRGTVVDPGGNPIGGVDITLESSDVERVTRSSDQPPGAYRFDGLPPGAYTITYARAGSRPQTLLVDLQAGQNVELAAIELEARAGISGRVVRDGVAEAGVGVVVYTLDGFPNQVVTQTVTAPGGTFEIVGLDAPQSYIVEFQVPAGGPVVTSRTLFLGAGETIDLEVEL